MRPSLAFAAVVAVCSLSGGARAAGVELTVILAADVSRSVDDKEFELQRKGYAAALTDPRVQKAIRATKSKAIGICFIEWSGEEDQQVVLPWTEIRDEEDGGGAAAVILKAPRSFTGRTSISAAIDYAMKYFAQAKWPATRRIIDVSGDGTSNSGRPITEARDQAIADWGHDKRAGDHQRSAQSGIFLAHPPPRWATQLLPAKCRWRTQRIPGRRQGFQLIRRRDGQQAGKGNRCRRRPE